MKLQKSIAQDVGDCSLNQNNVLDQTCHNSRPGIRRKPRPSAWRKFQPESQKNPSKLQGVNSKLEAIFKKCAYHPSSKDMVENVSSSPSWFHISIFKLWKKDSSLSTLSPISFCLVKTFICSIVFPFLVPISFICSIRFFSLRGFLIGFLTLVFSLLLFSSTPLSDLKFLYSSLSLSAVVPFLFMGSFGDDVWNFSVKY